MKNWYIYCSKNEKIGIGYEVIYNWIYIENDIARVFFSVEIESIDAFQYLNSLLVFFWKGHVSIIHHWSDTHMFSRILC